VAPVKWRSGLRDLPNAVLATRECGNSWDSSLGRCIEVIQTVTDPLTRISVAIHYGHSPEAMNSRPRGQLASVSSTQSNRLMSLKDEIPPAEVSPSQVSRYFDYPPTYSNHPRRYASSIPLQTGIPVTPAFGFRIPTPRSEILQRLQYSRAAFELITDAILYVINCIIIINHKIIIFTMFANTPFKPLAATSNTASNTASNYFPTFLYVIHYYYLLWIYYTS
jgi:hypothetical protein